MIFVPKVIDGYTIHRQDVDNIGRHYNIKLKNGENYIFPSMTTILSDEEPEYITKWKKYVGEKRADIISRISTDAGTYLHEFCEYVMLRDLDKAKNLINTCPDRRAVFFMKKILPYLKKYKKVYASEEFLFSLKYKVAGTTDAVVVVDNIIFILDFKTSKSAKNKDSIHSYYIQVAGYSLMWEEITGQVVDDAIILLVNPYSVQEFIVNIQQYKEDFKKVVDDFYKKYGTDYQIKELTN